MVRYSRRSFLKGAAGFAALGLFGCETTRRQSAPQNTPAAPPVEATECARDFTGARVPLWQTAMEAGIVYGSSATTWQLADKEYRDLYARESAILFTEDDLLWYRLKPTPQSKLDFSYGDKIVNFATERGMLVVGAHLVWDEGFGEGWTDKDLWSISEKRARSLIFDTIAREVPRYRGKVDAWIVANEVIDASGLRTDVPWFSTIGPTYVEEAFVAAHEADPKAILILNDYGFETDDPLTSAADKQNAMLELLDDFLAREIPVHAVGIQAHLDTAYFPEEFDADAYRDFLSEIAARDLPIMITEMDVLDDTLPAEVQARDQAVADAYRIYLEAALDEPAVGTLITFGLSDRYSWLDEDFPRDDGLPRRPLPFDKNMQPKAVFEALQTVLQQAPIREPLWLPPRCKQAA